MALLADLIDELTEFIRTALSLDAPSTPGHTNFLTSIQAAKKSFVEEVKAGTVELPCVVLEIGDFTPDNDYGSHNDFSRAPVTIHIIRPWGPGGNQRSVYEDAEAIKNGIDRPHVPFTNFLPRERGRVLTDADSPVNAALFVEAKANIVSSCVQWAPGFLVGEAAAL